MRKQFGNVMMLTHNNEVTCFILEKDVLFVAMFYKLI